MARVAVNWLSIPMLEAEEVSLGEVKQNAKSYWVKQKVNLLKQLKSQGVKQKVYQEKKFKSH
jgi:hypothetical protein